MATVSKIMSSGPQLGSQGYPTKVAFGKMAQYSSVRYESALNPKLQFWAKGTKVVGLPTCVAQLLPIWP